MLSAEAVESYREKGYVVALDVLDGAMLSRIRQTVAEICDGARGLSTHNDVYDLEPTHRPDAPRVRRIKVPHQNFPFFRELAGYPPMVEILKQLLGPGVRLHGSKINLKAPGYGSPVEWHQDWAFYPHTNDDLLAVGVMLEDMDLDNGALLVVPGTHKGPTWDHHDADGYFCGAMDPAACPGLDIGRAEPILAKAGSMSFHHVRAVHGSAQNFSTKPRTLLLYEFAAADAYPLNGVGDFAEFQSRMVAGDATIEPRLVPTPIRMPLPPARGQGSIYENQTATRRRYFELRQEPELATR
ncbi:MAG: phytanoyl-CoA dioxygenase family protein [Alphaproteobacteria bacterium]|nr:phytanoyl-CoA dioxygenase family protein [Alphaproteobacteria bacterium]